MGFFKNSRKTDLSSRMRGRVADTLCRSAYPVRRQAPPTDSLPQPVAFAKSDEDDSDDDSVIPDKLTRQAVSVGPRLEVSTRKGDVVVFDPFGSLSLVKPNLGSKKDTTIEVQEIHAGEPEDSSSLDETLDSQSCDASDLVDALQIAPTRDSMLRQRPLKDHGLYSVREHATSRFDLSQKSRDEISSPITSEAAHLTRDKVDSPTIRVVDKVSRVNNRADEFVAEVAKSQKSPSIVSKSTIADRMSFVRRPSDSQTGPSIVSESTITDEKPLVPRPGVQRPRVQRTRSFLKSRLNSSDSSLASTIMTPAIPEKPGVKSSHVLPKPRLLTLLEIRLQTLQDQYDQLNVQYHQLTSHQVETLEIVKDIKSDLCTTQITTAEHSIEIAGLQDTQRQLAVELATLKATVSDCKQELKSLKTIKSDSCLSSIHETDAETKSKSRAHRQWRVKEGTVLDLSQKEKPKHMSLEEYKLYCLRKRASSESLARTVSMPTLDQAHDELIESHTGQPLQLDSEPPAQVEPVTTVLAPVSAPAGVPARQVFHVPRKHVAESIVQNHMASKNHASSSSSGKLKVMAKDKISSMSYFHRFRTKATHT